MIYVSENLGDGEGRKPAPPSQKVSLRDDTGSFSCPNNYDVLKYLWVYCGILSIIANMSVAKMAIIATLMMIHIRKTIKIPTNTL